MSNVTPPNGRIPALDGLRGIAILLVLLYHGIFVSGSHSWVLSRLLLLGKLSWSGVDLFFVLSGFLIGGILLDVKESPHYFRTFYARRAFRILPLYGIVLGICFFARFIPVHSVANWLASIGFVPVAPLAFFTFSQNFWMAYVGKFSAGALNPTWSLAVEEQFYLTMPVIVRKLSQRHIVVVLASVVVCAPLIRTLLVSLLHEHGAFAAYVLMPCRADALALGALAAVLIRDSTAWNIVVRNSVLLTMIAFLMLLCLAWFSYAALDIFSVQLVTFGYSVLALFYTSCLLIALSFKGGAVERILTNRLLMRLGSIAYCAYLIHGPLIAFGYTMASRVVHQLNMNLLAAPHAVENVLGTLIGITLTIVLSSLSWRFVERPLLRRGHRHQYWKRHVSMPVVENTVGVTTEPAVRGPLA
jgi:peptidoglycan/LPS O-acetylase OafA/YrhL